LIIILVPLTACNSAVQSTQTPEAESTEPQAEGSNDNTLLFLGNKNIAPIVYLDGTTPAGVVVDIVHALAKHIPQPIEIRAMDWSEAQTLVAQGKADVLIQINQTEEHKKIYDFSDPLLESHFSIFTGTNRMGITGLSSLQGLRVGIEKGGLPQQLLEKDPQVQLVIIPNFLDGFKMLNDGSIDAVVVDYRVGSYVIAQNNLRNIKITGDPISSSYSSFAVKKGNTKLLSEINHALQLIKADGTYQRILDNWKSTEVVFQTQEQITQEIYSFTIVILLILFLISVIWIVSIRKELARRKAAEEKLREQYSTSRDTINNANALIFSVDRHYRYTSFNQGHVATMKALYGVEIEQGHKILEYMSVAEDREAAKRNLDRVLTGEQIVEEAFSGEELRSRRYFIVSHSPIKTEEGEIIGVAVLSQDITERKRSEETLNRLNRELRAISNCNKTLMRAVDEQTLLNDVCRIICDEAGHRLVWVGYAEHDETKTVRPVAWMGFDNGYIVNARVSWADDTERGRGPGGTAIRSGKIVYIQDFTTDPRMEPWRENALQRGYRSAIALPLKDVNADVFGVLLIYSMEIDAFTSEEIRLLEELAGDLAFGIVVLRTRAERKRAEETLRKRNEELERFEQATIGRELKMIELKKRIAELEEKYHDKKGDRYES
jgi:PAS domain S-box-containing protein